MKYYKNAVQILDAKIGIISNNEALIAPEEFLSKEKQLKKPEIWSLLTAFPAPEPIAFDANALDAFFYIMDDAQIKPNVIHAGNACSIFGDFSFLEQSVSDLRCNIFGNMGIFFSYALAVLEKSCQIHSMHASALYNPKENLLLIVAGSSGSGKTILQLEGLLHRGYELFSTEMTHFKIEGDQLTFYKGSMYDNIRAGNLLCDFPEAIEAFRLDRPSEVNQWETYIPVNFEPWSTKAGQLINPDTVIMFPRIETGRTETILEPEPGFNGFIKATFDNASEKICKSQVMYGGFPAFASFDSQALSMQRIENVTAMLKHPRIKKQIKLLAGPKDCWAWEAVLR